MKEQKKKIITVVSIIGIALLLVILIVVIVNNKEKEKNTETFETVNLSELINIEGMKNIPYETKFIMALRIMLDSDTYEMNCNKYEPTKYFGDTRLSSALGCYSEIYGTSYYDEATNTFKNNHGFVPYATVLIEDKIRIRMNQIFGPDTYYQVDSVNHASLVYKYIPEEQGYVTLSIPAGGTCVGHSNELTSAIKNDKEVILTVKKTTGENGDIIYNYEYTFTLNESDDSYYLTHISSKLA